jgi:hypothetical protein
MISRRARSYSSFVNVSGLRMAEPSQAFANLLESEAAPAPFGKLPEKACVQLLVAQ